jgi:putative ABC transport system permease protein
MRLFNRFAGGLRGLFRHKNVERELDDELRDFLENAVEQKMSAGMSHEAATRAARAEIGSLAAVKDHVRDVGWETFVESVWKDVRFTFRMVGRQPVFTLAVIATLALGIGGTTAIFTVVDALFLRAPDGISDPSSVRKVFIKRDAGSVQTPDGGAGSWVDYVTMRDHAHAFAGVAAFLYPEPVDLGRGAGAQRILSDVVSGEFLQVLGVRPAIGRFFLPEEDGVPGAHPVAVLSHAAWQARFGGTADILGKTPLINGVPIEIIGVTQKGFTGIGDEDIELWVPSAMAEHLHIHESSTGIDWRAIAPMIAVNYVVRLQPGVRHDVASLRAADAMRHAAEAEPELDPTPEVSTTSIVLAAMPYKSRAADLSLWLTVVAGLVLLIACANVANLLLARAVARRRELAIRLSLGAGAARLMRQYLTESLVLALLGGAAGVVVATWAMGLMRQFPVPPSAGRIDARLLLFALGLSIVTGLLFGVVPALRSVRVDPVHALKESRAIGALTRNRSRHVLVVLQISLSLALVVGAGLFVRSLRQVNSIHAGVDLNRLLVAKADLRLAGYTSEARDQLYEAAIARLATVPDVERAASVHFEPFYGASYGVGWRVPGRQVQMEHGATLNLAGAGYFETAGTRLLRGRTIQPTDVRGTEPVAVVDEKLARLMADDGNVVGFCVPIFKQMRAGGCTRIVGVVETQRHWYLEDQSKSYPMVFLARAQMPDAIDFGVPSLLIRTHGDPAGHAAAVRAALQGLRSDLPFITVRPLTKLVERDVLPFRLGATLFSMFGFVALALAAVGLYGVLGYFVTERTPEIGIRRTLGAPLHSVIGLVVRQGMLPVGIGLVFGLAGAFAGTRYLSSLLFGIEPRDPVSFAGASAFLVGVALIATLLPAWRAARVDPMIALRQE